MRTILVVSYLLIAFITKANGQDQISPKVLPEILVAQGCDTDQNRECTDAHIENLVRSVLVKELKRIKSDTLKVQLRFTADTIGKIQELRIAVRSGKKGSGSKRIERKIEALLTDERFDIRQKNTSNYPCWHTFSYRYLKDDSMGELALLDTSAPYAGGSVEMIPLFPSCTRVSDQEDRLCFQNAMKDHVKRHFQYPPAAKEQGIKGTVYIAFVIGADGTISNVRTRSPHILLELEAKRIISLLPIFQPGLANGIPKKVPYSIPITFSL